MKYINNFFKHLILIAALNAIFSANVLAQPVPGVDENIPFLVTFGRDAATSWGDDSFVQIFFFSIPRDFNQQFYIRVFDPDCGGEHDELNGEWNKRTMFSVYGGVGADPERHVEARGLDVSLNYKTGNLLASRVFGNDSRYDNDYYSFGPFTPTQGEFNEKWNSYIFKVICEGLSGDDGNLYRYFLSRDGNSNIPIEGANAFTYKYTFRLWNDPRSVSHIYPFIDSGVVSIRQSNFDWDNDGKIIVASRYKRGVEVPISGDDHWVHSFVPIEPAEVNSSLDFQFHKRQDNVVINNNVVIMLQNQRGDALQFYSSPIGGVPVYNPRTNVIRLPPPPR